MSDPTSRPVLDSYVHVSTTQTYRSGVDLIAVERAVNDVPPVGMTVEETLMAARVLTDHGVALRVIARHLSLPHHLVRQAQATHLTEPAGCGTDRGYRRHLRRSELPCAACRAARAAADRRYRRTGSSKELAA
ncbi:hypothetical protein [Streptomyces natalensis]|uniref:Uncharacterized protein n=1 Tax=Streptomyces natalensis ATCC 27448 TaxID=1240678 RepID=A0A0D7CMA4_9ACTN|nr:hypothetical protein [Streptomyces natalensis]KIZ17354.1 hypothetical protein SNA_15205 [Streptomyces natalensis ATCC 27448]